LKNKEKKIFEFPELAVDLQQFGNKATLSFAHYFNHPGDLRK